MQLRAGLVGVLLLGAFLSPARAALEPLCGDSKDRIDEARMELSDSARLKSVDRLRQTLLQLKRIDVKAATRPRAYWQTCLDKTVQALNIHLSVAAPKLRAHPDFNLILAQIYELREDWPLASQYAELALRSLPKDHALRLKCLELWLQSQRSALANKGNYAAFQKTVDAYLEPILSDKTAPRDQLIAAHQARASFLESVARFRDAVEEWQKLVELEPSETNYRRRLAAWELSRKRITEAVKILEQIVRHSPADLGAHKQLIEIYVDRKDLARAAEQARDALEMHPTDVELLRLQKYLEEHAG
jgi:tetratricopeptide (TPR) repeat protein